MDFLRLIGDDLQALRSETRKKYPVVREAIDKAAETLPYLQKQYAALLRASADGATAPGPGHPIFKSEAILRPFLLACNHTNASHKIIILALVSIQRLVSWDAIEQSSVGSILRVLQIQAEKNTHTDVQVKLLQTLLQLVTLGYEEKNGSGSASATHQQQTDAARTNSGGRASSGPLSGLTLHINGEPPAQPVAAAPVEAENALVGNEDLVMQAIWICIHLHGASSGANSVVGNTAAMTIRQVVSLAFGKVHKSPEAKHVGVLVFQELCFMSREESGVWLKRTAISPMSAALGVELLETILVSHTRLFRDDTEFHAVLQQHVGSLIQSTLELGCGDKHATSSTSGGSSSSSSNNSSSNSNSSNGPFFPLLVRVMRLASIVLCNFSDMLPNECTVIFRSLLEIVATGAYYQPGSAKSPSHAKIMAHDVKAFLSHSGTSSNNLTAASSAGAGSVSFVTWPVLLSLEVLNRVCLEPNMVAAITQYPDGVILSIARTISSVITTSPPADFKLLSTDALVSSRSGLEFLNEQDSPALQPFFSAIRVAITCQSNLIASIFDLSRIVVEPPACAALGDHCVSSIAPYLIHSSNAIMRYCREVELITMSLKSYHVLATIASRLRANMEPQASLEEVSRKMDDVVISCLKALCAFSFPLPDHIKSNSKGSVSNGSSSGGGGSLDQSSDDTSGGGAGEEGETCQVIISWREVHAMKALFGAAHIMEEELTEIEWCTLLEGFEIVVGLTDSKLKNGQNKIPTKNYRISAFRVEDEDVEQQLVMLGNSIVEFFQDALKLSSHALRKLLAAVRKVCWDQVGLPLPDRDADNVKPTSGNGASSNVGSKNDATATTAADLPALPNSHHMKIYQNYLGVGLTGSGTFMPCFALRMLTQLASSSKRCFEEVMKELVLMSTFVPQVSSSSQFPQLTQFQAFTTDNILQLMQNALQNVINSLSPTSKAPNQRTLAEIEAYARENPPAPHVFDQEELFQPLSKLMRSDMKDRALVGILDLLNSCGHLVNTGWPLVLGAIQEACEVGDSKTQVVAFKCLRLIVDDLLAAMPMSYLPNCVRCIGRFACCAKDVNISLTAVNELWSVADIIGKQKPRPQQQQTIGDMSSGGGGELWICVFGELSYVALDDRTEVRNSAINTLFGTAVTYGAQFELKEWQMFIDATVLPLASKLNQARSTNASTTVSTASSSHSETTTKSGGYVMHHSRDSAEKQWDESRVLMLTGISRVLQTNWHYLLGHSTWFAGVWKQLLSHVAQNAERGMSKEVVLASVNTLQTLLQVSSAADFDQIAQSAPVRAGAGMRVVGGALVASSVTSSPTQPGSKRPVAAPVSRDPVLWEDAFDQLLRLCNDRCHPDTTGQKINPIVWKEDEEQEIASSVVSVLVTLYTQAKDHEFKDERNVQRLLDVFEVLVMRHVLCNDAEVKSIANITTNSLQSRVLNAFEECSSFASHPQVHTRMLDQLVKYVDLSTTKELVFFTRHALTSLAKLYASVCSEARRDRFLEVLFCIQPFLKVDADESSSTSSSSPGKPLSATQKAASQLWKHALRVLLVLESHGLASVRLHQSCWRPLLATINLFLQPGSGTLPSYVQSEEDEVLVLSVLECMVDSIIALLSNNSEIKMEAGPQYTEFSSELMGLLCSGVDAPKHNKQFIKCCVRQLATLGIQQGDDDLSKLAQLKLVNCCSTALHHFATLEASTSPSTLSTPPSPPEDNSQDSSNFAAARERIVILLGSASEVGMSPRRILELFPALCMCITSSDLEVRRLIQRLLLAGHVSEYCLDILDKAEQREVNNGQQP
uniref:Protein MON2 homolog n=1 Tax=Globisporangium ultimum (strain ATCC 200006 / CBS 805.95 / DAOM BR144) TaxID=431595 RepID=K3W8F0_GLOUD